MDYIDLGLRSRISAASCWRCACRDASWAAHFFCIDCIPFMLSRFGLEGGIRERAIVQFKSQPKSKQLKMSILLLDDGSELRELMDAMPHDLAPSHPDLSVYIPGLRRISWSDHINEFPHGAFHRAGLHARGSLFPWRSSTMRAPQKPPRLRRFTIVLRSRLAVSLGSLHFSPKHERFEAQ